MEIKQLYRKESENILKRKTHNGQKRKYTSQLCCILLIFLSLSLISFSQGTRENYQRVEEFSKIVRTKIPGLKLEKEWSPNGRYLAYKSFNVNGDYLFKRFDSESQSIEPAFGHQEFTDFLNRDYSLSASPKSLPLTNFSINDDGEFIGQVVIDGGQMYFKFSSSNEITTATTKMGNRFELPKLNPQNLKPQFNAGETVEITFINLRNEAVKIYWLDDPNSLQLYAELKSGEQHVQSTFKGHAWIVTDSKEQKLVGFVAENELNLALIEKEIKFEENNQKQSRSRNKNWGTKGWGKKSPDNKWEAYIKDYNLHIRDLNTTNTFQLTTNGSEEYKYLNTFFWSPDSKKLVVNRLKPTQKHPVYIVESSPKDQLQPKLIEFNYLKPGAEIQQTKPYMFDVSSKKQIPVGDTLYPIPWRIDKMEWSNDSKQFYFRYNQRGHQVLRVIKVNADSGEANILIDDQSDTFIDYHHKSDLRYLIDTNEMIWMSERSGWNHLYLVDMLTGEIRNSITSGEWVVKKIESVDVEKRELLLQIIGYYPDQDPYYIHFAKVDFDGSNFTLLTFEDGTHTLEFSADKKFYIDQYSRVDLAPVFTLYRTEDQKKIAELSRADLTEILKTGWKRPEPFHAVGRDGQTKIYGVIYRPTHLSEDKKYPIIENIYAGPHGQHVPKSFKKRYSSLVELGFIVVRIDGMGTNWRSKKFHDVAWKNIGDAGFPDRIKWIEAAAENYPYIDTERVGIYGTSAGGQNAMRALIAHHDFYSVAIADCGCHDNRMDKIWWNEFWMGWPIDKEAYDRSSNVVQAHKMKGNLLLTVGELDKNVDPASTMQVVDRLIKADKDFDLIVFPGLGHGTLGSKYGRRKVQQFFVEHLWEKFEN